MMTLGAVVKMISPPPPAVGVQYYLRRRRPLNPAGNGARDHSIKGSTAAAATRAATYTVVVPHASGQTPQTLTTTILGDDDDDEKYWKLMEVYSKLKSELLDDDPGFDFTNESRQWLNRMLDYNVPSGRLSRVFSTINCYQALQDGRELSDKENFLACVLGWCIQWLQAFELVVDDIMDNSFTRNGQLCWFRLSEVGMIATNDASLLQAHIFIILKKHFMDKPYYLHLLDLFHEVLFQTACGQMLDVITPRENHDMSKYSMELYRSIAKYKGVYFTMYLPVACALILAGEPLFDRSEVEDILAEITIYYQIRNDYEDCFGDPEVIGKVGTDIEDGKCSWLIVKALEHANEEQRNILCENYGKADLACVTKVKEVYSSLGLQNIYKQSQRKSFEELKNSVEMHPRKVVQAIWKTMVERMKTI